MSEPRKPLSERMRETAAKRWNLELCMKVFAVEVEELEKRHESTCEIAELHGQHIKKLETKAQQNDTSAALSKNTQSIEQELRERIAELEELAALNTEIIQKCDDLVGFRVELQEIAGEMRAAVNALDKGLEVGTPLDDWASRIEELVGVPMEPRYTYIGHPDQVERIKAGGEQAGGDPCENDGVDYEALYATGPPGQDHDVAAPCRHCGHPWDDHDPETGECWRERNEAAAAGYPTANVVECGCPGYEAEEGTKR